MLLYWRPASLRRGFATSWRAPDRRRRDGRAQALSTLVLRGRHLQRGVGHRRRPVSRHAAAIAGMNTAGAVPLVQVMGMMVGVYLIPLHSSPGTRSATAASSGLHWPARLSAPRGFVYSAATGALPWSFGWICLFNDVIWWPVFWRFAVQHARELALLARAEVAQRCCCRSSPWSRMLQSRCDE